MIGFNFSLQELLRKLEQVYIYTWIQTQSLLILQSPLALVVVNVIGPSMITELSLLDLLEIK